MTYDGTEADTRLRISDIASAAATLMPERIPRFVILNRDQDNLSLWMQPMTLQEQIKRKKSRSWVDKQLKKTGRRI